MQGDHPSTPGHYLDPRDRRTSRRTLQRARKALDAAHQKTNQGRGKDVERKSPKTDFPSQLANPAHYAGFALSHRLCFYWLTYETGHFICSQKRTFSLANDNAGDLIELRLDEAHAEHGDWRADREPCKRLKHGAAHHHGNYAPALGAQRSE